jgi:hypothetical protein
MAEVILNGGNPLKDCPTDWAEASRWEAEVNGGNQAFEAPIWKWDCGFKLDFDGPLLRFSSRFYPPKTHYGSTWSGTLSVIVLGQEIEKKNFECETLDVLRTQVEAFKDSYAQKLVRVLSPTEESIAVELDCASTTTNDHH